MMCWLPWLYGEAAVWLSAPGLLRNWQISYNYPRYSQSGGAGVWTPQGQLLSEMGYFVCLGVSGMLSLGVSWLHQLHWS